MCKTMSIDSLVDLYVDSPAFERLQERTKKQYSYALKRMSDKISNTIAINDLTVPMCEGICAAISVNNGVHMAASLKRCSSALFAWAVRQGYAESNPWVGAKVVGVKSREVVWDLDAMDQMYTGAVKDVISEDDRYRLTCAIVYISYATAQRISDIKDLKKDDIDWQQHRLYMKQHKTGSRISVPLTDRAWGVLGSLYRGSGDYIFDYKGRPLTDVQLSKAFAIVREKYQLPKEYCARDARRTRVVELIDAGCTEYEIMAWTGHKNSKSLTPYAAIHGRQTNKAADNAFAKLQEMRG